MSRSFARSGTVVSAVMFALLIGAQTVAITHAYKHEPGPIGDTVCATCVSINQLAAIAVDSTEPLPLRDFRPVLCSVTAVFKSAPVAVQPRQRGPPV